MRDIALTLAVVAALIYALRRPWTAPLVWAWLSMMNPHRLTWSFAYNMPFAQMAAGVLVLVFLMPKNRTEYPRVGAAWLLIVFYLWTCITSLLSFNDPSVVYDGWIKVTKIQLTLFITMMMLRGQKHVLALVWVLVVSIGFFGVKGGLHTIARGGATMVFGPKGSFIEGTNHLALALIMIVPLMYVLAQAIANRWGRLAMWASIGLTMLAALGTASRGALLGLVAMAAVLGLKSSRRVATVLVMVVGLTAMLAFMPDQWIDKMGTIQTHEDHSAQSRIYTWRMILNLASHHPIFGGGHGITENPATWHTYAVTQWQRAYSPHSIYFQALAEHGYVGLVLYLLIGFTTWRLCSRVIRTALAPEQQWAASLCRAIKASLVGFAVGGAFVNLVNFDLPYYFVAIAVLCDLAIRKPDDKLPSPSTPAQR